MSLWTAVLAAGVLAWLTKLAGYLVPQRWLSGPCVNRVMAALPVALLAALVAVQTFDAGGAVRLDARAAGLLAAVVALMLRAPFLLVIVMAAATAAALRALGIG
ncbi:MAG TPA: AzlD domain-containing protein [Ottowia sp.]|nr:AzlD domain-containing protein [Ottowia sp.]